MKQVVAGQRIICFSRWSRKGYALFASLGKQVKICFLSLSICRCALELLLRKGGVILECRLRGGRPATSRRQELPVAWPAKGLFPVRQRTIFPEELAVKKKIIGNNGCGSGLSYPFFYT